MDSVVIRPFMEADVRAAGAIAGAMQPPYLAEEGMTLWQEVYRVAEDRFCLTAAQGEGAVIGCGALWRVGGGKQRLDVMVHLRWQRQGVGGELLAQLVAEARQRGAGRVQARARDDRPSALSFLQNRGFVERHRMERFFINPAAVDPSALQVAIERVEQCGVTLTTLATAQAEDPDCLPKLHDLYLAVIPDWPDPDPDPVPAQPTTLGDYRQSIDHLGDERERILLAWAEDRPVGFCGSLGTATHPAYRGWGIATAMEARVIERSRAEGHESLFGATANPAMRAVYAKLGYQRVFSEVRLIRWLEDEEDRLDLEDAHAALGEAKEGGVVTLDEFRASLGR